MESKMFDQNEAFELKAIHQSLLSDALFLIGTIISINENTRAEQEIVNPDRNQISAMGTAFEDTAPIGLGIVVLTLFLIGTAILALTALERVNRQKAEAGESADQTTINNIKGGETVILGQLLRIIGYIISIAGESIKAANPV